MSLAGLVRKITVATIRRLGRPGLLRRRVSASGSGWRAGAGSYVYHNVHFVPERQQVRDETGTLTGQYRSLLHVAAEGVVPQKNDQISGATREQDFANYWEVVEVLPVELSAVDVIYTLEVQR